MSVRKGAGTHDDGRLFGHDGRQTWSEPALPFGPGPDACPCTRDGRHVASDDGTCEACGDAGPIGAGDNVTVTISDEDRAAGHLVPRPVPGTVNAGGIGWCEICAADVFRDADGQWRHD